MIQFEAAFQANISPLHPSFGRFTVLASAPDVLHLSGHFANVSFSCRTGTVGQTREISYTFCPLLNQQPLSPKQQHGYRVSVLWSSQTLRHGSGESRGG